jgi:hypothetical protein
VYKVKTAIYKLFKLFGFRVISNSVDSHRQLEINNLKKENEKFRFLLSDNISRKKELFSYDFKNNMLTQLRLPAILNHL